MLAAGKEYTAIRSCWVLSSPGTIIDPGSVKLKLAKNVPLAIFFEEKSGDGACDPGRAQGEGAGKEKPGRLGAGPVESEGIKCQKNGG
jgi:hypothetical protein